MFEGIYIKLIIAAIGLSLIGGTVLYVRHLQAVNRQLYDDNSALKISNKELKDTIETGNKFQENVEKVSRAGDKVKEQNRHERDEKVKRIDESVKAGQDRPVGLLLRDFLNDK